jgi:DNA polymerase-1
VTNGDFAEIERRVMARANEIRDGMVDEHRRRAAEEFGVPEDEVTPTMRRVGKAKNFGTLYGVRS